jgi:hypothetical protein
MDTEMDNIVRNCEGRYLNVEEQRRIIEIAKTYEKRIAVVSALEAKEEVLTERTTELMLKKFPKFKERHLAAEKTQRDLSLTLRYIGHAILRNDPEFLKEKLLYWMQGVFASKGMTEVVRGAYDILKVQVQKELPSHASTEVLRYVDICIESCDRPQDKLGAA